MKTRLLFIPLLLITFFESYSQSLIPIRNSSALGVNYNILKNKKIILCDLDLGFDEYSEYKESLQSAKKNIDNNYEILNKQQLLDLKEVSDKVFLSLNEYCFSESKKEVQNKKFKQEYSLSIRHFNQTSELYKFINESKIFIARSDIHQHQSPNGTINTTTTNIVKRVDENGEKIEEIKFKDIKYSKDVLLNSEFLKEELTFSRFYNSINIFNVFCKDFDKDMKALKSEYKPKTSALKDKILLIRKDDLKDFTAEEIQNSYPHKVEFCSEKKMKEVLLQKSENHAVLQLGTSYFFYIIDTKTNDQLWYYYSNAMQAYTSTNFGVKTYFSKQKLKVLVKALK